MGQEFKDFRVSVPNLHDGSLESLSTQGKHLEIGCMDATGRRVSIVLADVLHLKADNFRHGNIIFSLEIFLGGDCSEEILRQASGLEADQTGEWIARELVTIAKLAG